MMRWLHGLRLAFFGDPAGFMDGLVEPFRTLGLVELTAATWIAARLAARPHWRAVQGEGVVLAAAFDDRGDLLAAAEAPGVLRLETAPARIDSWGGATVAPWDPWAVYRARRREGAPRPEALKAAWPPHGPRYLPGGAAPYGPPADEAYRDWLARTAEAPSPGSAHACDFVAAGRLAEGAEAVLAAAFANPEVSLVYADEDRLDAHGRPCGPVFKTAFDAVRLESQDYIGEAFAVRPALAAGGLDARRIAAALPAGSVRHIPRVLWRQAEAQAWRVAAPPAAQAAPPPSSQVIVPTRDRHSLLRACAAGVLQRTAGDPALCVVDNGSAEPQTLALLAELAAQPRAAVMRMDGPFDFPALNNRAAAEATAEVLVFLNDDTWVIEPAWLVEMAALAVRPDVGAVGAKLYYPDGRLQHAGVALGLGVHGVAGHPFRGAPASLDGPQAMLRVVREVSAVTGACLAVQRAKFEAVGGFDPAFKVAFNDVDLCLRLAARGWKTVWTPHARLVHLESATRGSPAATAEKAARLEEEAALMHARWGERLGADPYYHPALSLAGERWALGEGLRSAEPR